LQETVDLLTQDNLELQQLNEIAKSEIEALEGQVKALQLSNSVHQWGSGHSASPIATSSPSFVATSALSVSSSATEKRTSSNGSAKEMKEHELIAAIESQQAALKESHRALAALRGQTHRHSPENCSDDSSLGPECRICLSTAISVVLEPCKHASTCYDCAMNISQCPICRAPVRDRYQFFMS